MTAIQPWTGYALTGRPDFLNYLQRGDVSWRELWRFYREMPADTDAMVRLMGLFHVFMSWDYDREGCSLDEDGGVYAELRDWAGFVVECADMVPEEKVRENLASLLGRSLVSPLYYEAAFSSYLEECIHRHARCWDSAAVEPVTPEPFPGGQPRERRLALRLPRVPHCPEPQRATEWERTTTAIIERLYAAWNNAYAVALGDQDEAWNDPGGEG